MSENQGWLSISCAPFWLPNRYSTFLSSSFVTRSLNLSEYYGVLLTFLSGNAKGLFLMFKSILCLFPSRKGVFPNTSSYIKMPIAHQSTFLSYPWPYMISGAKYSGVPHCVKDYSFETMIFARPKSMILRYPLSSIMIFSSFKSLCIKPF